MGGLGGSGCPCPLCPSRALPRWGGGGQAEEGYSRRGGWKAACCHCALEFPHQDAGRQASIHVAEGVAGRARALASPVTWALTGPGFPQEEGKDQPGDSREVTKIRLLGARDRGAKETDTGRENQSAPCWGGEGATQAQGSPPLFIRPCAPHPGRKPPSQASAQSL